ncbi:MAG TPA: Holliday junction resolvase RuvX [Acidimicrobiia bacterium]|nr:Holliday junction resolvase RuvX [Acidimicrobiia bacterium]
MGRVLGVDLGSRRIGLALSDPEGRVAWPHAVLERSGDPAADHRTILAHAREADASRVVVGLPLSLSGDEGPAARAVLGEVDSLRAQAAGEITVETHDERFTTVIAERGMRAARASRGTRRRTIDASAAAVMLQSYLEART